MRLTNRVTRAAAKTLLYYLRNPREIMRPRVDELVTTADGLRYLCSYENHIERLLMTTGSFEPQATADVRRLIRPGWTVLDVGANVGYYTLLFSHLVGPSGQVHAFEPTSYAFGRLLRNMALNDTVLPPNIRPLRAGLLRSAGERREAIESQFSARVLAYSQAEVLTFTTLDDYCSSRNLTLNFVKIDVDGYDVDVVQGGRSTLTRDLPIMMCEFAQTHLARQNHSVHEYIHLLLEIGYEWCSIEGRTDRTRLSDFLESRDLLSGSVNALLYGQRHGASA